MRLLANENMPRAVVEALRADGHDVAWIRTENPGMTDRDVLHRAESEERTILTFDKDFGELAFRLGIGTAAGIILVRVRRERPGSLARSIVAALESRSDWAGHFSVIEADRIRMTPMS